MYRLSFVGLKASNIEIHCFKEMTIITQEKFDHHEIGGLLLVHVRRLRGPEAD